MGRRGRVRGWAEGGGWGARPESDVRVPRVDYLPDDPAARGAWLAMGLFLSPGGRSTDRRRTWTPVAEHSWSLELMSRNDARVATGCRSEVYQWPVAQPLSERPDLAPLCVKTPCRVCSGTQSGCGNVSTKPPPRQTGKGAPPSRRFRPLNRSRSRWREAKLRRNRPPEKTNPAPSSGSTTDGPRSQRAQTCRAV